MTPIEFHPSQKSYSVQKSYSDTSIQDTPQTNDQQGEESQEVAEQKKNLQKKWIKSQEGEEDKRSAQERKERQLEQLKDATNDLLAQMNIKLDFKVHKETDQMVVKVRNKENNEVIRQIPPEEMLELAKRMEEMSGMLLDRWS